MQGLNHRFNDVWLAITRFSLPVQGLSVVGVFVAVGLVETIAASANQAGISPAPGTLIARVSLRFEEIPHGAKEAVDHFASGAFDLEGVPIEVAAIDAKVGPGCLRRGYTRQLKHFKGNPLWPPALFLEQQGVDALVLTIGGKANAPTPHLSLVVLMGGATEGNVATTITVPSASLMSYRDIDDLAFGNKGSWHFIVPGWIGLST